MLGAVFNVLHGWLAKVRAPKTNSTARLMEATMICITSVGLMFALPYAFPECRNKPAHWEANYGVKFLCPEQEYNELATLFLSFPEETIQILLKTGEQDDGEYMEFFSRKSLSMRLPLYATLPRPHPSVSSRPSPIPSRTERATGGRVLLSERWGAELVSWSGKRGCNPDARQALGRGGGVRASSSGVWLPLWEL